MRTTGAGNGRGLSRRGMLGLVSAGGGAALLSVVVATRPAHSATRVAAATAPTGGRPADFLYLSILAGQITGKQGWPRYVPADFSVPAHALVQVEIRCFDTGPAAVPAGYEKVQGTVGGVMTVLPGPDPAATARGRAVSALSAKGVAHTLTMAGLGLNVPVPPLSTVRFTFRTGAPGSVPWECMASCGTGTSGWSGPMAEAGWMQGTMAVVG